VAAIEGSKHEIQQIWLGLKSHGITNSRLPPAVLKDTSGKSLSSWRFLLDPYIENAGRRYDIESAWDSPANASIREVQTTVFDVRGVVWGQLEGEPLRMAAIGADGKWAMDSGKSLKDLPGTTLLAISAPIKGTHWMQPSEVDLRRPFAKNVTVGSALGITRSDVVYLLFADGRVEVISSATPLTEIEQYLPMSY